MGTVQTETVQVADLGRAVLFAPAPRYQIVLGRAEIDLVAIGRAVVVRTAAGLIEIGHSAAGLFAQTARPLASFDQCSTADRCKGIHSALAVELIELDADQCRLRSAERAVAMETDSDPVAKAPNQQADRERHPTGKMVAYPVSEMLAIIVEAMINLETAGGRETD